MFSQIKGSPRRYVIYAGIAILIVAGYIFQARTTIEVRSDVNIYTCWHAHFGGHGKSSPEFTFIRHYHRESYVVTCEDDPTVSWEMPEGRGYQRFDGRRFEASDRWPEESGVYVFAMRKRILYVGHTTNMRETLSNPFDHEEWSCLNENGPPTHIYARQHRGPRKGANEDDVALLIETFAPPCNN